jgi:hypothetical protein
MKSLYWDLENSIVATGIHLRRKHLLLLTNFEQNIAQRPATYLPMKLLLKTTTQHAHYGFLQASTLRTYFLSIKLHVKIGLHAQNVNVPLIQEDLKGQKFKVLKSQQKWHQVEELIEGFPTMQTTPQTEYE